MDILGTKVLTNNILGQNLVKQVNDGKKYMNEPIKDTFVKTVQAKKNLDEKNTKKIIDSVILQNLNPETAIINNFDEEQYPQGIVNNKGKIIVEDDKLKKMFETLAETIPGYKTTYGRPQHDTHQYTLDVHTFKVLKESINTPEYKTLSDNDKLIVQMSIILHDIAKPAWKNDRQHPIKSAIMAKQILDNLNFPKETNKRIVDLIKNHGWFELYNRGITTAEDVIGNMAYPKDFKLLGIITQGDTKSVNDWFYGAYCTNLPNALKDINKKN